MSKASAFFLLLCGAGGRLWALGIQDVGTTSADFLKLGSGARSEAMGEAYVGVADDADGIAYNPAGMAQNLSGSLSASHALWFQGLTYDNFNFILPVQEGGTWGGGFDYLSSPQIARTVLTGTGSGPGQNYTQNGYFSPYDMAADLSYARPLVGGLLWGAGLKLLDQSVDTQSALGLGLDLGLFWQAPLRGFTAGLAVQNLGTPVKVATTASNLPAIARAGAAYRLLDGALLISAEGDLPTDDNPVLAAGAEYDIADRFFPRIGWRYDGQFNPWTLGFGMRYDVWGLDLSAVPYGPLGMTYRASVDWRFGGPQVSLSARLAYVSMVGTGRSAMLAAGMSAPSKVETWAVYICDASREARVVRVLSGFGPVDGPVLWDGRDASGRSVAEGVYWAALSVRYAGGQTVHSPYVRLRVVDRAPVVTLGFDPSSLNPSAAGEAYVPTAFRPRVVSGGGIEAWRLEILDPRGLVFRSVSGTGALPDVVIWDGKGDRGDDLISAQVYAARLEVTDALGNESASPAPLGFKAVFRQP